MTKELSKADLAMFTGTEEWYRHPLVRKILYTEGAKYVADNGGAYWLIDELAFSQSIPAVARERFQVWNLKVNQADNSAVLRCEDGNYNIVFSKMIDYTDFPLDEIRFFLTDNVILLPSEY